MTKLSELIPGEKERAALAKAELPAAVRDFHAAHYQDLGSSSSPDGTFVGLACRVCGRWREIGHSSDCPVAKRERGQCQRRLKLCWRVRPPLLMN